MASEQVFSERSLLAAALLTTVLAIAISVIVFVDVMWEMALWSNGLSVD